MNAQVKVDDVSALAPEVADKSFIAPPVAALSALCDADLVSVIDRTAAGPLEIERPLLDEALSRHPNDASINEKDGIWYYATGRFDKAIAALDRAIRDGAGPNAYLVRGEAKRQLNGAGSEADIEAACLQGARSDWCKGR